MTTISRLRTFLSSHLELLLHVLFLAWYFGSLQVAWGQDWLVTEGRWKVVHPFTALALPAVFYINAFWLIPRYLKRKRWVGYLLGLLILWLGVELVRTSLFAGLRIAGTENPGWPAAFREEFFTFGPEGLQGFFPLAVIASWGYRFARDWLLQQRQIERLEREKATVELAFLKSQVDPHFLFNTLNSLYALALEEESPKTADGIARLGGLMRYSLHDSQEDRVPLGKEIEYIRRYVLLQRLRLAEHSQIDLQVDVPPGAEQKTMIVPLLLIPFVENACKYGVSPRRATCVDIRIRLEGSRLILEVENTVIERKSENGGVGLENVKNRLALLYPGRHRLVYGPRGDRFHVLLEINLSV